MSRRNRLLLAALSLGLLLLALAALTYALGPAAVHSGVFPLDPTLLVPPGSAP